MTVPMVNNPHIVSVSILTCPNCGFSREESLPVDACQFFYQCTNCAETIRPKQGDCCVFCSFGTVKCQTKQMESYAGQ